MGEEFPCELYILGNGVHCQKMESTRFLWSILQEEGVPIALIK